MNECAFLLGTKMNECTFLLGTKMNECAFVLGHLCFLVMINRSIYYYLMGESSAVEKEK